MKNKIYSVFGPKPPRPESYPETIRVRDEYGEHDHVIESENQFYGMLFWYWHASPLGVSQVTNVRGSSENDGVLAQSNEGRI